MISGETVLVSLLVLGSDDAYGNPVKSYTEGTEVGGVLCGRGSSVDLVRDGQPYAIQSDKRFCFPKGYAEDLRGAIITHDGFEYEVVGEPVRSTDANMPPGLPWNLRVEAVRRDG